MNPRRAVRAARSAQDADAEAAAHHAVNAAEEALGERGPAWWDDGAPDLNRKMARNTSYAEWYAAQEAGSWPDPLPHQARRKRKTQNTKRNCRRPGTLVPWPPCPARLGPPGGDP
ncbi:hypothetical protein PY32053_04696 (plasmid) [Paracoccus yeei]|uniref:Uncharacterized protein n=1 Tax=Paracoccus yeei TaxID=147645 RepID=A0A386UU24_9RHOB|nr:hypothetical protein PY32053_04696 [Paracoccus yeei]